MELLDLFEEEVRDDDRAGYVADPAALYPAALAEVRRVVVSGERPDGALGLLFDRAVAVHLDEWDAALKASPGHPQRAELLEVARLWATELLHQSIGGAPLAVHILKDERWKL